MDANTIPATMRRWEMEGFGRAALELRQVAVPRPGPGEVLAKVAAVALNYRDLLVIADGMGAPLRFPFTPASDFAGTVVATGEGATRFVAGARVISTFFPGWIDGLPDGDSARLPYEALGGAYPGVLAEYVALPEAWLAAAPATCPLEEASTLPCAGLTAWFGLVERGGLRAGDTVLVEGTGGVALFGAQIAKAMGARVIVVSGSAAKLERARALGADILIDRTSGDWVEAVRAATGGRGADHVLALAGGAALGRAVEVAAMGGRIAQIGIIEGFDASLPLGPLMLKQLTLNGIGVGHRRALEDFVRAVDATGMTPVIDGRYALAELPAALDHLARGAFGKIVVTSG